MNQFPPPQDPKNTPVWVPRLCAPHCHFSSGMQVWHCTTWGGSLWCCGASAGSDKPIFGWCPHSQVSPHRYKFPRFVYTSLKSKPSLFWNFPCFLQLAIIFLFHVIFGKLMLVDKGNFGISVFVFEFWRGPELIFTRFSKALDLIYFGIFLILYAIQNRMYNSHIFHRKSLKLYMSQQTLLYLNM